MKITLAALALSVAIAVASPVADGTTNNADQAPQQFLVSKFDVAATNGLGDGWLFSPPGLPNGTIVRFYQNNNLMGGRKGSAWVFEVQEDVTVNQVKALKNVRNAFAPGQQTLNSQMPAAPRQGQSLAHHMTSSQGRTGSAGRAVDSIDTESPCGQAVVPAALAAPVNLLQGGATITSLIQQAGNLIGSQIGTSLGNLIGSTLEGVVTNFFPAPKAPA